MRFKVGEPIFLFGQWGKVRDQLYGISVKLQDKNRKILFIDALNVLDPHHEAFCQMQQGKTLRLRKLLQRLNMSKIFHKN